MTDEGEANAESQQNSTFRQMRRKRQQLSEKESGFSRMLMIRFDIEHLTGKEAIELVLTSSMIHPLSLKP